MRVMTMAYDLTGQRFGDLVVTGRCDKPRSKGTHWFCTCDCGKTHHVARGTNLTSGNTVSCGNDANHSRIQRNEEVHGTGATFEEIAQELGISRSLARAEFQRALRKLRNNIDVIRALREYR